MNPKVIKELDQEIRSMESDKDKLERKLELARRAKELLERSGLAPHSVRRNNAKPRKVSREALEQIVGIFKAKGRTTRKELQEQLGFQATVISAGIKELKQDPPKIKELKGTRINGSRLIEWVEEVPQQETQQAPAPEMAGTPQQ